MTSANNKKRDCDNRSVDECLFRMAARDISALEELYDRAAASVYGFALSVLKNTHDAEDVLHDCFVMIYSAAGNYRSDGKPMAWILTITRNLCLQKIRERQKTADVPQEDWEQYVAEHAGMSQEDKLVLSECMRSLSDQERQIVTLHAVSGLKHREIAAFLKMPLSTVLSKYNRALKKLHKQYAG